jgi:hypothetical protein
MTQKRKAELQRKLSMAPVANPPSDLADRIKGDIPRFLDAQHDRDRLNRSIGFSLRVAASVILVITSAFLAIEMMSRDAMDVASDQAPQVVAKSAPAPQTQAAPLEAAPVVVDAQLASKDLAELAAPVRRKEAGAREEKRELDRQRNQSFVAETSLPPATAAPAAAAAAPAPPPVEMADAAYQSEPVVETASKAVAGRTAMAEASLNLSRRDAPASEMEVDRLKKILREGNTPGAVDVRAVVDHFAGRPETAVREVRLEVEASRAPLAAENTAIIRYTIDMPERRGRRLTEAKLSIALETAVVNSYRTISGARPLTGADTVLADGESATGLVEVRLIDGVAPDQRIATILLDYQSRNGESQKDAKPVYARDLDRSWQSASRRHRLATLSAVWSESLAGAKRMDVARAAAEIAQEAPGDQRAQELAEITASSRPRTSVPTGSGR